MLALRDLNRSAVHCHGYHVVFCLDESGSMHGPKWEDLTQAFTDFVGMCTAQGGGLDMISVVQFGKSARKTLTLASLDMAQRFSLKMTGGGTCFAPALSSARELFQLGSKQAPGLAPMMVFMSDGENHDGDVSAAMSLICQEAVDLQCHTIFFGSGGSERLERMAEAVPGGKYHLSIDGVELKRAFEAIAADVTAL
mmetsp:Transcript_139570/g.445393  ORF Transcript_139570/g.445393 Transcript_139570/m.445393 type:complete len:196 (-) Transcript_139570:405-992(-)